MFVARVLSISRPSGCLSVSVSHPSVCVMGRVYSISPVCVEGGIGPNLLYIWRIVTFSLVPLYVLGHGVVMVVMQEGHHSGQCGPADGHEGGRRLLLRHDALH